MPKKKEITAVDMDFLVDLDQRSDIVQDLEPMDWYEMEPIDEETAEFIKQWKETIEVMEKFRALCKEHNFKPR